MIEFRPIPDFEGTYFVSRCGTVKNKRGHVIKQWLHYSRSNQYMRVTLFKNGAKSNHRVHRLVALTFIDNPDNLPCVDHIDGNTFNNHVNNLQWLTHSDNIKKAKSGINA